MTKRRALLSTFAIVAMLAGVADARPRPRRGKRFEANKTFGAGLELGSPSGLNGKYFLSRDQALDFGIGYLGHYYYDRYGANLYLDYLWHPVSLVSAEAFELPLYFGIGGRIWDFGDDRANDHGFALGARVPLGVSFDFNNVPLDVFVQLTFVADFFIDYGPHRFYPGIDGSIGIRYWFN
jgi:hypothetical protein